MTENLKKITAIKKLNFFFWSKTAIYLSLGLHKVCPGYRRELTKEAIQHFKTWIFSPFVGHFCPPGSGSGSGFRIRIRIHWPDWIRIQSRSGSETLGPVDAHNGGLEAQNGALEGLNTSGSRFPSFIWGAGCWIRIGIKGDADPQF